MSNNNDNPRGHDINESTPKHDLKLILAEYYRVVDNVDHGACVHDVIDGVGDHVDDRPSNEHDSARGNNDNNRPNDHDSPGDDDLVTIFHVDTEYDHYARRADYGRDPDNGG